MLVAKFYDKNCVTTSVCGDNMGMILLLDKTWAKFHNGLLRSTVCVIQIVNKLK
jgi:hypothetical protein